ncbi:hypothetical protein BDC45DRAFT_522182 [Circinella umbellata]|nr:hypothetical protein BDC45DRAFT_522182 [Circinella umbellata]
MNNNKQLLHSPNLSTRTMNNTSSNFMRHVGQDETLFISQATDPFNNITTTNVTTLNHSPTLSIPSPITSSYDSSSNSSTPLTSSPKLTSLTSPTTTLSYPSGQQQQQRNTDSSTLSCHHQSNSFLDDEAYFQLSEYLSQNTDNNNHSLSLQEEKITKKEVSSAFDNKNGLQIRVIGAPDKSRVETQTRLCIQLVTTHGTKVTSWPCLKLPERLLARSRLKKSFQQQQQQQQQQQRSENDSIHQQMILSDESSLLSKTIYLDAKVVCASQPDQPVKVCSGCIQRERKRAERSKNQHKNNNNNNAGSRSIIDTIPEQDRILLFNCGPMVNFSSGDAILPTRITCYCRHHNEKLGFHVQFTMKNGRGDIIARGMSPPILITDDHKSTRQKNRKRNRNVYESKNSTKNSSQQQQQKVRKLPSNKTVIPVTPAASRRNSLSIDLVDTHFPSLGSTDPNDLSILDSQSSSPIITPHAFHSSSLPTPGEERNNPYGNSLSSFFPLPPLSSSSISPTLSTTLEPIPCSTTTTIEHPHISSEHLSSPTSPILSPPTTPQLERLVPAQGPTYGGCEVTILGSNFYRGLTCLFGEHQATTVFWNPNTLVCVLPPAAHPGPVVVSFKQHSLILEGHDVPLFTYYDANDQALLELALQVVGLKMTGKLQDAKQIAMRIVQGGDNLLLQPQQQQHQNGNNNNNNNSPTLNASNFYFAQSCSNNASGAYNSKKINRSGAFIPDPLVFLAMTFNDITNHGSIHDPTLVEDKVIQVMNEFQVTANDLLHVCSPVTYHTLLHLAVWGDYTKLAMKLINLCPQALHAGDRSGIAPLVLARIKGHKTSIVLDAMVRANMTRSQLSKSSATIDLIDSNQGNDKRHHDLSSSSILLQDPSLLPYMSRPTPMTPENLLLLSTPTFILPEEAEIKKEREFTFKSAITTTRSKPVSDILTYSFCSSVTPLLVSM